MKAKANRTLADLDIGREPLTDRVRARIARSVIHLTEGQKVGAVFCLASLMVYSGLGMIRCLQVVLVDNPGIEYIRWLDWWWMWLFAR